MGMTVGRRKGSRHDENPSLHVRGTLVSSSARRIGDLQGRQRPLLVVPYRLRMSEVLFPRPTLADELVLLRPWTAHDVPARLAAFQDPWLLRFSWPRTTPLTEADIWSSFRAQEEARLRGEELNFALVEPRDPSVVLGGASIYGIDLEQGRAGVGYWVAREARRRGVASHATRLLARWALAELGVARLELTCGPDNEASQRVALRCGFVLEGVLRSHLPFKGGRRDTVMFSLLPGELR